MNPGRQILVLSTVDTIAMVTGMSDGRWIFLEEPRAGRSRGWEEKESRQRERMKRNVPIATQRDRSLLACELVEATCVPLQFVHMWLHNGTLVSVCTYTVFTRPPKRFNHFERRAGGLRCCF